MRAPLFASALMLGFTAACADRAPEAGGDGRSCTEPAAREVVQRFGDRLKMVSLQAPESLVVRQLRDAYGDVATPEALEAWIAAPSRAPGRLVSSPWPDRIRIDSIRPVGDAECAADGVVIQRTSADSASGSTGALSEAVTVRLRAVNDSGWRVSGYEPRSGPAPSNDSTPSSGATGTFTPPRSIPHLEVPDAPFPD